MTPNKTSLCEVCGKPANVQLVEIQNGVKTTRSYCVEHAPIEVRDKLPFGPQRTVAEEVAFLRGKMVALEQQVADPAERAEIMADVEKLIEEIEAGRRRLFQD